MENKLKNLRPRGAVGMYIVENGKLLLFLRNSAHAGGTWCPPGGHIEYGEDIEDAAKREAKEEAGIKVTESEILGVTSDVYRNEEKHYITAHVKAVKYEGNPKLMEPDKFDKMKWFDLSGLPKNIFPANKHFLSGNPQCLCGSGMRWKKCHGA